MSTREKLRGTIQEQPVRVLHAKIFDARWTSYQYRNNSQWSVGGLRSMVFLDRRRAQEARAELRRRGLRPPQPMARRVMHD
jgi:hypothetical protein